MYEDMYTDYSDQSFCYYQHITFAGRNVDYLQPASTPRGEWHRGDKVHIQFDLYELMPDGTSASTFFDGKDILVSFYNSRADEMVHKQLFVPNDTTPTRTLNVYIDLETSKKCFKPGIYYCVIQLLTKDANNEVTDIYTLLNEGECFFHVI